MSTVHSSRRPTYMSKVQMIFARSGAQAKFAVGPTSARPGPTFPAAVETGERGEQVDPHRGQRDRGDEKHRLIEHEERDVLADEVVR